MEPQTLLVVDADRKVRALIKSRMQAEGWQVHEAAGGLQALAICACRRVDVLLTDLNLPDIRGEELAQAVSERFPGVLIIGMAAASADHAPGPMAACISKSLEAEALVMGLREALQAPPKKPAASASPTLHKFRRPG